MPQNVPEELSRTIETLYRSESGRILATLARLLGDLNVAEEVMHEAFAAALDTWPQAGVPDKPRPWLISTRALQSYKRNAPFLQTGWIEIQALVFYLISSRFVLWVST